MNPGKGSAVDTHPTDDNDRLGEAPTRRSRMLHETPRHPVAPPSGRHRVEPLAGARLIPTAKTDRYVLVEVAGEIDILNREQLADVLTRAVDTGPPAVIVDLSAVTLLSAAGIHCLQHATVRLTERGGSLHLVCPPHNPADRILRIFEPCRRQPRHIDVEAAIRATLRA